MAFKPASNWDRLQTVFPMHEQVIAILEDEMLIAMDIKSVLQRNGYENIILCSKLRKLYELLNRITPDLAILDINIGGGQTSFGAASRLSLLGVSVIFLSGYSSKTILAPSELSTIPRLQKPFVEKDLLDTVSNQL